MAVGTAEDNVAARFVVGVVVFLLVALAYPWYSYWVTSNLMSRDLGSVAGELNRQSASEVAALNRQLEAEQERQTVDAERRRVGAVRVVGASMSSGLPVVVVQMGQASLHEATPQVCRQAAAWVGRTTARMTLRVQRHRGNAPALDVGTISC